MFAQVSETQLVLRPAVTGGLLFALPDSAETRRVHFSPDSRLLAIAKSDGTAKMWDLSTRRVVWKLEFGDKDGIDGLAFSPDGELFATTSWSGPIKVYDVRTMREMRTLKGHIAQTTCLAFSSDSRTLASASDDSTLRLWNLATSREMIKIDVAPVVRFLAFSPDGEILAVSEANGDDNTIRLLRAPPMSEIDATPPPPTLIGESSARK